VGNCPLASSAQACILQLFQASIWERLQHNIPLRAYQPCSVRNDFSSLTLRLTTPPQMNIPKCDSHWVFQCDHKLTTLPRVYSSRSCACPLFHPRNHALLLREYLALSRKSPGSSPPLIIGQPIKGWSISVFILWVLQCHYRAHHLDKSQLVLGTCACPLLLHSSRVLMLHKSPTYCPRQMSSSSLIFSMGAISMKVNPAFVSIFIIATSLAIHLSTYI